MEAEGGPRLSLQGVRVSSGGQILGGVVGAFAGFMIGGAAGALKGASIGMSIGGVLDPPKLPTTMGPRLTDTTVQTSTYGATIPRVYGTVPVVGNIFWLENNSLKEVSKKTKSSGKGGSKQTTVTFSYFATFAVGLCQGPIAGVRRIWAGSKLIYDAGASSFSPSAASSQNSALFNLHLGDNAQAVDDRMQASLGIANTPAFRGLAYLVLKDFPLADYGNSLTGVQIKVEVATAQTPNWTTTTLYNLTSEQSFGGQIKTSWCDESTVYGWWTNGGVEMECVKYVDGSKQKLCRLNLPLLYGNFLKMGQSDRPAAVIWVTSSSLASIVESDGSVQTWTVYPSTASGTTYKNSGGVVGKYLYLIGEDLYFYLYKSNSLVAKILLPFYPFKAGYTDDYFFVTEATAASGTLQLAVISRSDYSLRYFNFPFCTGQTKQYAYPLVYGLTGDCARIQSDTDIFEYKNGSLSLVVEGVLGASSASTQGDYFYMPADMAFQSNRKSTSYFWCAYRTLTSVNPYLSSILQAECLKSGVLQSLDIDASAITKIIRGYKVSNIASIRSSIEILMGAYAFQIIQKGYKIYFVPRGTASVATIKATELSAQRSGT